jgi:hypothetical protein
MSLFANVSPNCVIGKTQIGLGPAQRKIAGGQRDSAPAGGRLITNGG